MREIVVGTDRSGASVAALAFAGQLGRATGAYLTVVSICQRAGAGPASQAEAELTRRQAAEVLDPLQVRWRVEARAGDPATELDHVADDRAADLIVVAGRGGTMAQRLLLDATASNLAHRAGHSVLVVR